MFLTTVGLSLIIIGWIEQLYRTVVWRRLSFSPFFLALYIVGAAVLALGDFYNSEIVSGVLTIVTVLLPLVILIALILIKKKPGAL